jgi:hypothetical protein
MILFLPPRKLSLSLHPSISSLNLLFIYLSHLSLGIKGFKKYICTMQKSEPFESMVKPQYLGTHKTSGPSNTGVLNLVLASTTVLFEIG